MSDDHTPPMEPTPHRERKRRRRANASAEQPRKKRRVVKVTEVEDAQLDVLARRQSVTVPRLLVESALALGERGGIADRRMAIESLFELRRSLAGIANNVNQLAAYAHQNGVMRDDLRATMEAVRASVAEINETVEWMRL